jgi:1-acyl-sn-glycerol-3-phosphate acyltransferase
VEPLSAAVEAVLEPPLRRGLEWTVESIERIPATGGVVLVANHTSFLDPPCLAYVAHLRHRRVRFLAMAELFQRPVFGTILHHLGHVPVRRGTAMARFSLAPALAALQAGECVGVFPEGGISRDLEPRPGQTGAARLAAASGVPVVPVGLWGAHRLASPGGKAKLRLGVAEVACVGPPILVEDEEDAREATDRIMEALCVEVARARSIYPQVPSPGEDPWWYREPGSAQLRSCRRDNAPPDPTADAELLPPEPIPAEPQDSPGASEGDDGLAEALARAGTSVELLEPQLRSIPFFRNLPGPALEAVAASLQTETYATGDIVFREGEAGETMYLVATGKVDVVAGTTEAPLASLGPGSFVGEIALLLGEPRSATLRVQANAILFALRRGDLDALLAEHPSIGAELSRELGRRLVATSRRLVTAPATRMSAIFGDGAADLAAALLQSPGIGRIGVLVLPEAKPPPGLPQGVTLIELKPLGAETVAGLAGREIEHLAHLLLVLPPSESATARAAVNVAEYVVAFGPVPGWATPPGPGRRVLHCGGGAVSVGRAARWVSGRAIGLALSSGGSKALAHLGVLRVLREAGVVIDAVAGTSGGAMVAAGLALGMSEDVMLDHVRDLAAQLRLPRFDFNIPPRAALFKGIRLRQQLDAWYEGQTFEETEIPCWVVATEVAGGAEVVIDRGPLADGVRASLSIPGAFNPWPANGRMCIDGAVVNPMPASVLRNAGLRIVIGSNVAGQELDLEAMAGTPHLLQIMGRMVNSMEREMVKAQVPLVDVLIRPVVAAAGSFDFSRIDEFVAEGERAAREQIADLRSAVTAS